MQNRYVGDVGDFGKYGLLRWLIATCGRDIDVRLGVVWYLYPNEDHNSDGGHTAYLKNQYYRKLDRSLHEVLGKLISSGYRNVVGVEDSSIFPENTIFFRKFVCSTRVNKIKPAERAEMRDKWFQEVLLEIQDCNFVFLDPDNGIAPTNIHKGNLNAGKYAFLDEIELAAENDRCLIIYHHTNRQKKVAEQIKEKQEQVCSVLPSGYSVVPMLFRKGSCRIFWIALSERHKGILKRSEFSEFLENWRGLFWRPEMS